MVLQCRVRAVRAERSAGSGSGIGAVPQGRQPGAVQTAQLADQVVVGQSRRVDALSVPTRSPTSESLVISRALGASRWAPERSIAKPCRPALARTGSPDRRRRDPPVPSGA